MDIFESNDLDVTIDQDVDYLEALVGEGKKFKDVSSLAKGKAEADAYVKLLEARLDEANKELNTRTSLDSFLDQMKAQKSPVAPEPTPTPTPGGQEKHGIDDSDIEARLEALLARREAAKASESNAERVKRVLNEQLGDKTSTFIKQKSQELGMSTEDLSGFAQKSPSAFFRLVGIDEGHQPSPVGTQIPKSSGFGSPTSSGIKNKAYFDKLKQTDPKTYRSPKTTGEMMKAMAECRAKGIAWE